MKWFLLILLLALGSGLALLTHRLTLPKEEARQSPLEVPISLARGEVAAAEPGPLADPGGGSRSELKPDWQVELDEFMALGQPEAGHSLGSLGEDPFRLSDEMIAAAKELYASQWLEDENGEPIRQGPWESTHPNGRTEELGAYDQGREEGLWQWWYEDGTPQAVGRFENGERVGAWTWHHENGALMMEGAYEAGAGAGEWVYYYDNGLVRGRGAFIDDEINGSWQFWNDDGSVDEERTGIYENGELVR